MSPKVVRADDSERGAVLIITALLVPALVLCGALAFGVTALWTGRQDVQRATDLGALAAAANTPTVSTELPIAGLKLFQQLGAPLDASDWRQRACEVTRRQFVDGRSPVATGLRADTTTPSCTVQFQWESPLLATLGACVQDVAELAGCKDGIERELRATLPEVATLDASVASAAAAVGGSLPPTDKIITADVATQLRSACASETSVVLLGAASWLCTATVGDLLGSVDHETGGLVGSLTGTLGPLVAPLQAAATEGLLDPVRGGLGFDPSNVPQVGVDLAGLVPAVLTPRVHVDVDGLTMKPTFSPLTFDVATGTTARRVIKSALVLPSAGIPGTNAFSSLPAETQGALFAKLGLDAPSMLADAEGGWVVDPNVLTRSAPVVAQQVLSLMDSTESTLSSTTSTALCDSLPPSVACPVGDDLVDRQHLLGPFMEDVWDATRPPPDGSEPSIGDVLADHADSGEPLFIVSGLRSVLLGAIFGPGVWQTIKGAHVGPQLGSLLSELMFVPALDVVPASVHREGSTFRIERVLATTGLYKARLVK